LDWVLDQVPVGRVLESGLSGAAQGERNERWDSELLGRVRQVMRARRLGCSLLRAGDPVPGFPELEVLWPPRGLDRAEARKNRNDACLVLGVEGWLLLPGDLSAKAERALLRSGALEGRAWQALKLGHHGSRTSTHAGLLAAVRPGLCLVSAGRANRFAFPHGEVLDRLKGRSALARTDLMGCLRLEHGPDGLSWAAFRDPAPAGLWQAPLKPLKARRLL
jgi:beta-lactamase superfamily II metal-dependent hydrolase